MNIELHTKASKRYIQVGEEVNCIRSHCSIFKKKGNGSTHKLSTQIDEIFLFVFF